MAALDDIEDDDGPLASINIIPFVDIVLVLLVIFMLTSATIVRASLKVELPKAASGGGKVETTINIVYTKTGELMLNGEKLASLAGAAAVIRGEVAKNPKVQAVISADKGVEYGKVVEIIDTVKQNGVSAFALDIERGAPPAGSPPVPIPAPAQIPPPAAPAAP
ncbi:MAG: biopolymer transporter ExbD [Bacteroidota bacterium]